MVYASRIWPNILAEFDAKQIAVSGKSTSDALVYLLHLALEALDKGQRYVSFSLLTSRKALTSSIKQF